ncbi:MAG: ABC transporter permease [bacterium]|nr:ABC transporter permease [bacterium]
MTKRLIAAFGGLLDRTDLAKSLVLARVALYRQFRQWRWWWLAPVGGQVLFGIVIFFAFSRLFPRMNDEHDRLIYGLSVYSAILVWSLIQDSALMSANLFNDHRPYILRFKIPLWSYALGGMGIRALVLASGVVLLTMARLWICGELTWRLLALPLFVPGILIGALGISWLVAVAASLERRIQHVLPHLLLLWFFSTPVVYPRSALPDNLRFISALNPMTHVVECFQWVWIPSREVDVGSLVVASAAAIVSCVAGFLATWAKASKIVDSL